jgi:hypothetical protein
VNRVGARRPIRPACETPPECVAGIDGWQYLAWAILPILKNGLRDINIRSGNYRELFARMMA